MSETPPRTAAIVGATSVIAAETARLWVTRGTSRLHLVGRDARRLERVADDLRTRSPDVEVSTCATDLCDPRAISATVADVVSRLVPDTVLIAHGGSVPRPTTTSDLRPTADQLIGSGVSPVLWLELFAATMPSGTVAVVGSPAGDRGRRANYLYGASKAMIATAAEGLQHRLADDGVVHVVLLKPGPTRSPMTVGMPDVLLTSPDRAARLIARAIARRRRTAYVPGAWRWASVVVRMAPGALLDRLDR